MAVAPRRGRSPSFILSAIIVLFSLPGAVAQGQTPIPAFNLPPWISVTQTTTVKDTRASDGANAQVVCNVTANVQLAEQGRAPVTLTASLVATWTPAQNQWAFAENTQAGAIPFFPGISLGTLRLVRPQATWCFTGTFSLDPFRQKAASLTALPETLGFTVDASGFTAHLPVPTIATLGAGVTIGITGVELLPDANTGQLGLGLDATLTWGTTVFAGLIAWTGNDVVFTLVGKSPSNGVTIPSVCTLTFVSLQAHLAGTLNLTATGHLTPAAGTPAADLFGPGFDFTLSGPVDAYTINANFASSLPQLSLGGLANLTVNSASLSKSSQNSPSSPQGSPTSPQGTPASSPGSHTWGGGTSLNLGSGPAITGLLDLSGSGIRIGNVSLPGLPPGLSLGMARVNPPGAPAIWSGAFDTSLQPADVSALFAGIGFPSVSVPAPRGISGTVSGNAMRFSFKDLPPLPVTVPSWMSLQASSIREFNFTRETGGAGRAFIDVVLDFDLSGIPGFAGASKVPVAILAGNGIAPATFGAASNGSAPWFGPILAGLGGNVSQRFNWYVPSGTPSSAAGLAFGPAGPTSIPGIPVSGVGNLALTSFVGGYQNGAWNLGGRVTLSGLRSFQFMDFGLPTSLDMDFTYDGTTFKASHPASHLLTLVPGMTLTLGDYSLSHTGNAAGWAFGMDGAFSWMGAAPVGGHVDLAAAQVKFLPQASLLHFDLPGSFDPDMQNLQIGMVTPFTCAGDANIPLPSGGPVASMLGGMKGVGLFFSAGPSGWLLSTLPKAPLPTIDLSGGDTLSIQSMSLQVPKTGTNMVFSCAATLGLSNKSPISGTLTVSDTTFALDLQDAQIVQGLGVHASLTLTKDSTGKTLFNGTIDGTVSQQDLASLYQRYGLTAASAPGGNITISGSLSNTIFDLDIRNFPPPAIPGLTGVTFKDIDDLHLHVDRGQKKETLSVTTDLAIAGLIDNLRVALEVDVTPAPTSPDLSVSLILNATGRGPSVTLPDLGTIVFNSLTGGRKAGVWSVTGNLEYTVPSAWCAVKMGTFSVPSRLNLGLTLDPTGFAATMAVPPGTMSLEVLPGFPIDLKSYKFSVMNGKVAFGIVSGLKIPNAPSVGGGIDFSAGGIAFTIEPGVTISLPICDLTKKKVADLAISNLKLSLADLSLGGDITLTLSGDPKKDLLLKVLGTNTFKAVLSGSPTAFSVKIVDLKVQTTLSLGKLGTATLGVSFLQFGSDGTIGGTGTIAINNQSLVLSVGMQAGCPYVGFTPKPSIDINVNNIFDFRLTNEIRLGTNLAGFATMTVQGVHLTVGPASNPAGEVDAVNFVYYLPDPEVYFPGMVFFDSFTGYVNVAGFKANLTVELPDPLSAANAQAVLQNLFAMLSGNWKPSDFDKLTAPAFGLHNVYVQFPTVPGQVWDDGQKAFVQTNDLFAALFKTNQKNFVLVSDYSLKLSKMLESCGLVDEKQMGIILLNAINGTRQLKLLGLDATSTINLGANGLHTVFDLSLNIPGPDAAHSVIQTSGHFEGDIGSDGSFDFEDDGILKVKVGSTWYTVEQTHLILSSKTGFSFRGSILGAVGTGTIKPNGEFSFTGNLNTKGSGASGIVATFTANNQELKITGKSYVNGVKIWDDEMTLENGNLTFKFSGKTSDHEYDVKVTFGLTHPSFTFTGSASGTYDLGWPVGKVTAKSGEITFHIDTHTISTDLYYAGVKAKTFEYNFQTGKVAIK